MTGQRPAPAIPGPVVVTGAAGFIGSALSDRLTELGVEVRGVDLAGDRRRGIREGDTRHPEGWADVLVGAAAVVHTAASVSNVSSMSDAWQVNVLGTSRVLEAAADAGVGHFVHVSSIAAFGHQFPADVTEEYPTRIEGHSYADTKVNGEAVVLAAHASGRIPVTVIRPGDVYGPGSRPWVLIPIELIRSGQAVLPLKGRGVFSPTYVDNLVDAMVLTLAEPDALGQVFTVTDGEGVACVDYFQHLGDMLGKTVRTVPGSFMVPVAGAMGAVQRRLGRHSELSEASMRMLMRENTYSIAKARAVLGYEPAVDLDEGMARVRAWLIAQGIVKAS